MINTRPIFEWDSETGKATCVLSDGKKTYTGYAECHEDDRDMMSLKTGCEIALKRAEIQVLRAYRDELKIRLSALNQYYHSMNMSHRFNEKSYENRMLQRQIRMISFDLTTIKEEIATREQDVLSYIAEKEKFYKRIRHNRKIDIIPVEDKNN